MPTKTEFQALEASPLFLQINGLVNKIDEIKKTYGTDAKNKSVEEAHAIKVLDEVKTALITTLEIFAFYNEGNIPSFSLPLIALKLQSLAKITSIVTDKETVFFEAVDSTLPEIVNKTLNDIQRNKGKQIWDKTFHQAFIKNLKARQGDLFKEAQLIPGRTNEEMLARVIDELTFISEIYDDINPQVFKKNPMEFDSNKSLADYLSMIISGTNKDKDYPPLPFAHPMLYEFTKEFNTCIEKLPKTLDELAPFLNPEAIVETFKPGIIFKLIKSFIPFDYQIAHQKHESSLHVYKLTLNSTNNRALSIGHYPGLTKLDKPLNTNAQLFELNLNVGYQALTNKLKQDPLLLLQELYNNTKHNPKFVEYVKGQLDKLSPDLEPEIKLLTGFVNTELTKMDDLFLSHKFPTDFSLDNIKEVNQLDTLVEQISNEKCKAQTLIVKYQQMQNDLFKKTLNDLKLNSKFFPATIILPKQIIGFCNKKENIVIYDLREALTKKIDSYKEHLTNHINILKETNKACSEKYKQLAENTFNIEVEKAKTFINEKDNETKEAATKLQFLKIQLENILKNSAKKEDIQTLSNSIEELNTLKIKMIQLGKDIDSVQLVDFYDPTYRNYKGQLKQIYAPISIEIKKLIQEIEKIQTSTAQAIIEITNKIKKQQEEEEYKKRLAEAGLDGITKLLDEAKTQLKLEVLEQENIQKLLDNEQKHINTNRVEIDSIDTELSNLEKLMHNSQTETKNKLCDFNNLLTKLKIDIITSQDDLKSHLDNKISEATTRVVNFKEQEFDKTPQIALIKTREFLTLKVELMQKELNNSQNKPSFFDKLISPSSLISKKKFDSLNIPVKKNVFSFLLSLLSEEEKEWDNFFNNKENSLQDKLNKWTQILQKINNKIQEYENTFKLKEAIQQKPEQLEQDIKSLEDLKKGIIGKLDEIQTAEQQKITLQQKSKILLEKVTPFYKEMSELQSKKEEKEQIIKDKQAQITALTAAKELDNKLSSLQNDINSKQNLEQLSLKELASIIVPLKNQLQQNLEGINQFNQQSSNTLNLTKYQQAFNAMHESAGKHIQEWIITYFGSTLEKELSAVKENLTLFELNEKKYSDAEHDLNQYFEQLKMIGDSTKNQTIKIEALITPVTNIQDKDCNKILNDIQSANENLQNKVDTSLIFFSTTLENSLSTSLKSLKKLRKTANESEEYYNNLNTIYLEINKQSLSYSQAIKKEFKDLFKTIDLELSNVKEDLESRSSRIEQRKKLHQDYHTQLTNYLTLRNQHYSLKDTFFSKDKLAREVFINNLKNGLETYTHSGDAKTINELILSADFPGKHLRPILCRLFLELNQDSQVYEEETIKSLLNTEEKDNSDYKKQLNNLLDNINILKLHSGKIQNEGDAETAEHVKKLADKLTQDLYGFIQIHAKKMPTKEEIKAFQVRFQARIHSQDDLVSKHRNSLMPIIANILIALFTLGLAPVAQLVYTKYNTGCASFFFAKTKREELLDSIEEESLNLNNQMDAPI